MLKASEGRSRKSGPRPSIHAKCLKFLEDNGVMLICSKSKGHAFPQCYDVDEGRYFSPQN